MPGLNFVSMKIRKRGFRLLAKREDCTEYKSSLKIQKNLWKSNSTNCNNLKTFVGKTKNSPK